jgi:hypothetical protein
LAIKTAYHTAGTRDQHDNMARLFLTVIGLLIIAAALGVAYFAMTDVPPPAGKIVHVIPESRLPK